MNRIYLNKLKISIMIVNTNKNILSVCSIFKISFYLLFICLLTKLNEALYGLFTRVKQYIIKYILQSIHLVYTDNKLREIKLRHDLIKKKTV